jgi:predicted nucleic acid-binding Zn ribbon protein
MGWDDDDEWGRKLPDDPKSVEERRRAWSEIARWRERAFRWAYAILALLIVLVVVIALTR